MKKLNAKYFTIAVYTFAVVAFSLLFLLICLNFGVITAAFGNFLSAIVSILYGIFFAFLLFPAVKRFDTFFEKLLCRKKKHPVWVSILSIATAFLILLGTIVAILVVLIPLLIKDFTSLYEFITGLNDRLNAFFTQNAATNPVLTDVYYAVRNFFFGDGEGNNMFLSSTLGSALASAGDVLGTVISQTSGILMGLIIAAYLLSSRRIISAIFGKVVVALLPEKRATHFVLFFKRLYTDFCTFAFSRFLLALAFAVCTYLLCLILRIGLPSVIVILILVSHMVPVIGPIVGTSIAIALAFALSSAWQGLIFGAALIALEVIAVHIVLPFLLPKKLRPSYGLAAVLVLLGLSLFGVVGAFLAIPLFTTIGVEVRHLINHRLSKKKMPINTDAYENFGYDVLDEAEKKLNEEKLAKEREARDEEYNED